MCGTRTRARSSRSAAFGEGSARRARATLTRVVRHPWQEENREALWKAAYNGKTEEVRRYIGMGVDVDWKNPDKVSLRHTRANRPLSRGEIANERTDPG